MVLPSIKDYGIDCREDIVSLSEEDILSICDEIELKWGKSWGDIFYYHLVKEKLVYYRSLEWKKDIHKCKECEYFKYVLDEDLNVVGVECGVDGSSMLDLVSEFCVFIQ